MVTTIDPVHGKVIWPWSKEEEAVWAKDILQKYGEVTYLDRDLYNRLHGLKDAELAMRRRLGIEPSPKKEPSGLVTEKKEGELPSFIPAKSFEGSKPGYVFRRVKGTGLGYHLDKVQQPNSQQSTSSVVQKKGKKLIVPEKEGELPSFIPAKSYEGSKPGYVFRRVKGTGLGYHRDDGQPTGQPHSSSTQETTNQNITDPKLAVLRKHRTEHPSLTHKERLQALQKADKNLWGKVTLNNFKKLINKDNKLSREDSTKMIGKTGYATKSNSAAKAKVIGRTGYAKKNRNTNRSKPIPTDYDSRKLPLQRLPSGASPCQLCGRHLKFEKYKDNIVYCRSDGGTENKTLKWALDSDLYEPRRADIRKVKTLVICRYCDPPPPWGTGPPLTSQSTPDDYFDMDGYDDYSSDDDGDYGIMESIYGGGFRGDAAMFGFSEDDAYELLCQGVMPWDDDADDVLAVLNGEYY